MTVRRIQAQRLPPARYQNRDVPVPEGTVSNSMLTRSFEHRDASTRFVGGQLELRGPTSEVALQAWIENQYIVVPFEEGGAQNVKAWLDANVKNAEARISSDGQLEFTAPVGDVKRLVKELRGEPVALMRNQPVAGEPLPRGDSLLPGEASKVLFGQGETRSRPLMVGELTLRPIDAVQDLVTRLPDGRDVYRLSMPLDAYVRTIPNEIREALGTIKSFEPIDRVDGRDSYFFTVSRREIDQVVKLLQDTTTRVRPEGVEGLQLGLAATRNPEFWLHQGD